MLTVRKFTKDQGVLIRHLTSIFPHSYGHEVVLQMEAFFPFGCAEVKLHTDFDWTRPLEYIVKPSVVWVFLEQSV